jgi:hypothetical protein
VVETNELISIIRFGYTTYFKFMPCFFTKNPWVSQKAHRFYKKQMDFAKSPWVLKKAHVFYKTSMNFAKSP